MESLHKYLLICDLFNDTAKRKDFLMSNMWLMNDEIRGKELLFRLAIKQKVMGSIIDGVMGNVH